MLHHKHYLNILKVRVNIKHWEEFHFLQQENGSALELEDIGTIIVGAGEFIIPELKLPPQAELAKKGGARVLLVAHYHDFDTFQDNLQLATPLGCIVIEDPLRDDAYETIQFFKNNDVEVKVISGDNPVTD